MNIWCTIRNRVYGLEECILKYNQKRGGIYRFTLGGFGSWEYWFAIGGVWDQVLVGTKEARSSKLEFGDVWIGVIEA